MIFQLILPVLLTPTNYCFQDQVTPPSDRLWVVNQTFTKLDMVYSDFLWSPPDMVSVLILDSRKYGHHQFYLYLMSKLWTPPRNLSKLYRSYYPHTTRDSVSPVCGIFSSVIHIFGQFLNCHKSKTVRAFHLIPTLRARPEYQLSDDIHSHKAGT